MLGGGISFSFPARISVRFRLGGLADARGATTRGFFLGVSCSASSRGWNSDNSRRSPVALVMLLECERTSLFEPRDTVDRREVASALSPELALVEMRRN